METEVFGIVLGTVLPRYPLPFAIYQKIGTYDEIVGDSKNSRTSTDAIRRSVSWKLRPHNSCSQR